MGVGMAGGRGGACGRFLAWLGLMLGSEAGSPSARSLCAAPLPTDKTQANREQRGNFRLWYPDM